MSHDEKTTLLLPSPDGGRRQSFKEYIEAYPAPEVKTPSKWLTIYVPLMAFAVLCLSRGTLPLVSYEAEATIPPVTMNAIRGVVGGLLFLLINWIMRLILQYRTTLTTNKRRFIQNQVQLKLDSKEFAKMSFMAVFQSQLPVVLVSFSVSYIPSGLTSVLVSLTPIFTQILKMLAMRSKETRSLFTNIVIFSGLILGVAGCVLVCLPTILTKSDDESHSGKDLGIGVCLAIIASLSWAVASLFNNACLNDLPQLTKAMWQTSLGGIFCVVIALAWEFQWPAAPYLKHFAFFSHVDAKMMGALAIMVLVTSVLAVVLNYYLLDTIKAVKATCVWLVVPIVGMICGVLFQGEWKDFSVGYRIMQVAGCVTIIIGLFLVMVVANMTLRTSRDTYENVLDMVKIKKARADAPSEFDTVE